ncbi:MAG: hypothetical protein IPO07_18800 [Haliscomenobacter sp.]|nr:hypothetical protein [Haliscomenobacter sp.]MBK9490598.1 hypothetical protein [Haliscomenobacter sp.]
MKIVGIFSTKNKATDESKVYLHIAAAQQLVKAGPTYITDIYANIKNLTRHGLFLNCYNPLPATRSKTGKPLMRIFWRAT